MQLICPVNQRKGNIMRWRTCTPFCMCVCWSSLLAAQRLNYEGCSSTGSAECIWKAPLAAAKRSWMIPEHSSQARCFWLESLTICWCNYKGSTVGPAGVELTTSRMITRCSTNWATSAHLSCFIVRLVDVRRSGPPILSLFGLHTLSCIAYSLCNRLHLWSCM